MTTTTMTMTAAAAAAKTKRALHPLQDKELLMCMSGSHSTESMMAMLKASVSESAWVPLKVRRLLRDMKTMLAWWVTLGSVRRIADAKPEELQDLSMGMFMVTIAARASACRYAHEVQEMLCHAREAMCGTDIEVYHRLLNASPTELPQGFRGDAAMQVDPFLVMARLCARARLKALRQACRCVMQECAQRYLMLMTTRKAQRKWRETVIARGHFMKDIWASTWYYLRGMEMSYAMEGHINEYLHKVAGQLLKLHRDVTFALELQKPCAVPSDPMGRAAPEPIPV